MSRDPVEEKGGGNLYGFVSNRTLQAIDVLGRLSYLAIRIDSHYNIAAINPGPNGESLAETHVVNEYFKESHVSCGQGKIKVTSVRVMALIEQNSTMPWEVASMYPVYPGHYRDIQAHEDEEAYVLTTMFVTIYQGYSLLADKCVCRPCYEQWAEKFLPTVDRYARREAEAASAWLDCEETHDPTSNYCKEADRLRAALADVREDMRLHREALNEKCRGSL